MGYCSESDVALRLGLDAAQRTRASTRVKSAIRRAGIFIDQEFRDYGRDAPSAAIGSTTLSSGVSAGDTSMFVTSIIGFSSSGGNGDVDGDSFSYTGIASGSPSQIQGVSGLSFDHASGTTVSNGEFAHVLREISADLAASLYLEDDAMFHTSGGDPVRSNVLRQRATAELKRLAHLGTVD
jgi:hypothetical protein